MSTFRPEKIFIDVNARESSLTKTILKNTPGIPKEDVADVRELITAFSERRDPIGRGKRNILVTTYKGQLLKPCPGTPRAICCAYQVINPVVGCPFDCTYCALQMYFNNPLITVYVNLEELFGELDARLKRQTAWLYRIGTGELTDSLALDHITEMSSALVPYFARKQGLLFELKTKSSRIERLLDLKHGGRTVVAWSLNPQHIIDREECGAASLEERLLAANMCQQAGYKLAFHFDPLICYTDWELDYAAVVDQVFEQIDARSIAWISLGTFRYPPTLKPVIRDRFPRSKIILEDFIQGQDGKMRYVKPLRIEMYSHLLRQIRARDDRLFVYLCMESNDIWKKVFGWSPNTTAGLARMFKK